MTALSHSPADVVAYLIVDQSLGSLPSDNDDWPVYVSSEPDTPDNAITVYDTSGILEGRIHYSGRVVEKYGIQIRVRGTTHQVAYDKLAAIIDALDQDVRRDSVSIPAPSTNSYRVHSMNRRGGILHAGRDTRFSKLEIKTVNYTVTLDQLT